MAQRMSVLIAQKFTKRIINSCQQKSKNGPKISVRNYSNQSNQPQTSSNFHELFFGSCVIGAGTGATIGFPYGMHYYSTLGHRDKIGYIPCSLMFASIGAFVGWFWPVSLLMLGVVVASKRS